MKNPVEAVRLIEHELPWASDWEVSEMTFCKQCENAARRVMEYLTKKTKKESN